MIKIKNVLSCFDGISCGQIALNRLGIKYDKYYSSEIDKSSIFITQKNYPKTIQIGDITKVNGNLYTDIDLLIGGSPCQDFSYANKERKGLDGEKSSLFYHYVRLLNECSPKYFLLENVRMDKESQKTISSLLGIEPILINSSLVSCQSRNRLYWTNIKNIIVNMWMLVIF